MDNKEIDKLVSDENEHLNKLQMNLLMEKQIKTLFETHEKQFTLLSEINLRLETHLAKIVL